MSETRLLSINDAAKYLGVSPWHVRRLVWRGDLPSVRVGRLVRLDRGDLDQYIEEQKSQVGNCVGSVPKPTFRMLREQEATTGIARPQRKGRAA